MGTGKGRRVKGPPPKKKQTNLRIKVWFIYLVGPETAVSHLERKESYSSRTLPVRRNGGSYTNNIKKQEEKISVRDNRVLCMRKTTSTFMVFPV